MVLGSMLAALSLAINFTFIYLIPSNGTFRLPLYAIPLVLASVILGKYNGIIVAIVCDFIFGMLNPYGFLPLYSFAAVSWGFWSGFFCNKKYSLVRLSIGVYISYLCATTTNSIANYVYYGKIVAMSTFFLRILVLVVSTPILIFIIHQIYVRVKNLVYLESKIKTESEILING